MYPGHGEDIDALFQSADAALYAAKSAHRSLEVYSPDCNRYTPERLALLGELRGAIAAGELVLHYQLKIDLASGEVRTVEALVRSQHPERDLIPPGEFAPFAGHSGVIRPLTAWVLDAALARCAAWRAEGVEVAVAVNLSAANVTDDELVDEVVTLLARWEVAPRLLELEVPERMLMSDPSGAGSVLGRLRAMGIAIALDDFGTGHASLAHLKRLPVSELKTDRAFVSDASTDEGDAAIVGSVIALAHSLGLRVPTTGRRAGRGRGAVARARVRLRGGLPPGSAGAGGGGDAPPARRRRRGGGRYSAGRTEITRPRRPVLKSTVPARAA